MLEYVVVHDFATYVTAIMIRLLGPARDDLAGLDGAEGAVGQKRAVPGPQTATARLKLLLSPKDPALSRDLR